MLYWLLLGVRHWTVRFTYLKLFSNLRRYVLLPSFSKWEHQVSENLNDLLDAMPWIWSQDLNLELKVKIYMLWQIVSFCKLHRCTCVHVVGGKGKPMQASQQSRWQYGSFVFSLENEISQFGKWNISEWKWSYDLGPECCRAIEWSTLHMRPVPSGWETSKMEGFQVPKLLSYHQRAGLLFKIFLKMYFGFFHYISLQHILTNMELNILNIN